MSLKDISLKKLVNEILVAVDPKEVVGIVEKQVDNYSLVICTDHSFDYPHIYDNSIHINLPKAKAKEIIAKVLIHRIFYYDMREDDYQLYLKTLIENGILSNKIDPTTCRRRDVNLLFEEHIELNQELNGFETCCTEFYFTNSKDQTIQNIINCILGVQLRREYIIIRDHSDSNCCEDDDNEYEGN